jgi:cysteine desulfurase
VLNVIFEGIPAEAIVQALDLQGIAVSAGAACSSGSIQASPVLEAMGEAEPDGGVRISMGPRTTPADVEPLVEALPSVLDGARLLAEL